MGYPVKVTYKKSTKKNAKKYTKNYSCKVSVKEPSIAVKGADVVAVGTTEKLTSTVKPSTAKATFKSSDDTIATVDANGTVTGVKAGKATITATATVGTKTVTATKDIEVKNYVLDSVVPTEANVVSAVVKGNTKNLKKSDFVIANAETKATVAVTEIKVDSKDASKVSLTLAGKLTDAKEYSVTLDGVTKTFTASDGKIDSISVDPVQIPYATAKEIDLVAKDAKGIIVNKMPFNKLDAGFSFTFTKYDGTLQGEKLYLNKVGSTAEAKISYTSSEYNADGTPKQKLEQTVTITAVDQAAINNYAVRIGSKTTDKFDKLKDDTKLAVGDNGKYAFIKIKDADGTEVSNYGKYRVESSDNNILLLEKKELTPGTNKDAYVAIKAVTTGTAYIVVKKDDKYCTSLPISVVAKREAASLTIDNASFTLSNKTELADKKTVEAKAKDQYGDDFTIGSVTAECVYTNAKGGDDKTISTNTVNANEASKYYTIDKNKVTFNGKAVEKGTYTWTINLKVNDNKTLKQTVSIEVKDVNASGSVSYALEVSSTSLDAKVKDDAKDGDKVSATVQIALCKDSVKDSYQSVKWTVKKDNKVVTGAGIEVDGSQVNAENVSGTKLEIIAMKVTGTSAEKLAKGSYEVTATWTTTVDGKQIDNSQKTIITVDDTQSGASVDTVNGGVSTTVESDVRALAAKTLQVTVGDDVYANDGKEGHKTLTITKVEGTTLTKTDADITNEAVSSGKSVHISKIKFTAQTSSGISYEYTVTVDKTVTNK